MSSTLEWFCSGNGTQVVPSTSIGYLTDLKTLIDATSPGADFSWECVGSQLVSGQTYILLARKNGSAGRIAIMSFQTAPTNRNPTLFGYAAVADYPYIAWFPNGTGTTLSNLNATSGTICGNDTDAVKVRALGSVAGVYASGMRHFYYDSAEGMYFCTNNPASASVSCLGAGLLVEDESGVAMDSVCSTGGSGLAGISSLWGWTNLSGEQPPGYPYGTYGGWYVNDGSGNSVPYYAWASPYSWCQQLFSATDSILADAVSQKAWFIPITLMTNSRKGQGVRISIRQMGYGPGQASAFFTYYVAGPDPVAQQMQNLTAGHNGCPYLTNFKID